jgi:hypothetical protein
MSQDHPIRLTIPFVLHYSVGSPAFRLGPWGVSKTALGIMQSGTFFGAGWYVVHLIGLEHIDQTKPNEPIRAATLPGFDITQSV